MALSRAPQLQWAMDNTANGVLAISRGLIQAATSDNVQVLALLTCESFGTTLPMSTITRLKVENLARQNRMYTLEFLKAQVGYKAGDAADVLSKSDGGIRFLCLAAILMSWGTSDLGSAQLLGDLIRQNRREDQSMPTLLQLRDLLVALKPKLLHSGFIDDYLGWRQLCIAEGYHVAGNGGPERTTTSPGRREFAILLDALRQHSRMGDENLSIQIECWSDHVPWIIAVVKWFTESPPKVRDINSSASVIPGDGRIVVISNGHNIRFWVTVVREINTLEEIVSADGAPGTLRGNSRIAGSISFQQWFKLRIETLRLEPAMASPLLRAALIKIPEKLLLSEAMTRLAAQVSIDGLGADIPCPFPDIKMRLDFLNWIVGDLIPENTIPETIENLLEQVAEECDDECGCTAVQNPNASTTGDERTDRQVSNQDTVEMSDQPSQNDSDEVEMDNVQSADAQADVTSDLDMGSSIESMTFADPCLRQRMGQLIADVLSLILFDASKGFDLLPQLAYPDFRTVLLLHDHALNVDSKLVTTANNRIASSADWPSLLVFTWWHVLSNALDYIACRPIALFKHARNLIGYGPSLHDPSSTTCVSSSGGQVIYPALMEERQPCHSNYLRLRHHRGTLFYEDVVALSVDDVMESHFFRPHVSIPPGLSADDMQDLSMTHIDATLTRGAGLGSAMRDQKAMLAVHWDPSITILKIELGHFLLEYLMFRIYAWDLINGVTQVLFTRPCKHKGKARDLDSVELQNFKVVIDHLVTQTDLDRPKDRRYLVLQHDRPGNRHAQTAAVHACCIQHWKGCIACALRLAINIDVQLVIC